MKINYTFDQQTRQPSQASKTHTSLGWPAAKTRPREPILSEVLGTCTSDRLWLVYQSYQLSLCLGHFMQKGGVGGDVFCLYPSQQSWI